VDVFLPLIFPQKGDLGFLAPDFVFGRKFSEKKIFPKATFAPPPATGHQYFPWCPDQGIHETDQNVRRISDQLFFWLSTSLPAVAAEAANSFKWWTTGRQPRRLGLALSPVTAHADCLSPNVSLASHLRATMKSVWLDLRHRVNPVVLPPLC